MTKEELIAFYANGIIQRMEAAGWEKFVLDASAQKKVAHLMTMLDFRRRNLEADEFEVGVIILGHSTGDAQVMGNEDFSATAREMLLNLARTHLLPSGTPGVLTA